MKAWLAGEADGGVAGQAVEAALVPAAEGVAPLATAHRGAGSEAGGQVSGGRWQEEAPLQASCNAPAPGLVLATTRRWTALPIVHSLVGLGAAGRLSGRLWPPAPLHWYCPSTV